MIPINCWAVVAAAVANMILGGLWYGPLFGKPWMKLMGMTKESMSEAAKKGMAKSYAIMFVGSLLMSYVLAHAYVFGSTYLQFSGALSGMEAGFYNWLGFVAPVTISVVLWDGKPWKLWFLNAGYYLVGLCLMGGIIGAWS